MTNALETTARSAGLHHVTLMASDPARNVDFHTRVLGLRLVKTTVNFDDPSVYHLYFGDRTGAPGTALTFFPFPDAAPGHPGVGETVETAFAIPRSALGFWLERFARLGVVYEQPQTRFGETALPFRDPDGARYALVAGGDGPYPEAWATDEIAAEHAIGGFHGVTLLVRDAAPTARVLTEAFGYADLGEEKGRRRLRSAGDSKVGLGAVVDVLADPQGRRGLPGAGSVHHIAFRAAGDEDAMTMRQAVLRDLGLRATEQVDRNYFRSIYFREPGGVLFEIATDDPGFLIDETMETLGTTLKLPPQYEPHRDRITAALPSLSTEHSLAGAE